MAKTESELKELMFALTHAEDILALINYNRVKKYGIFAEKVWSFQYVEIENKKDLEQFTEWQREHHGIREGEEYLLIFDISNSIPSLLYVINVSADSVLCCMHELFGLLMDKF